MLFRSSWFDWRGIGPDDEQLLAFVRRLIALRRAHPALRRERFLHGRDRSADGLKDITWLAPQGTEKTEAQWRDTHARCFGMLLNGQAGTYRSWDGRPADDQVLLLLLNAYHDTVPFTLPPIAGAEGWRRILDTTEPEVTDDPRIYASGKPFDMPGRSVVLLVCQPA